MKSKVDFLKNKDEYRVLSERMDDKDLKIDTLIIGYIRSNITEQD